MANNRMTEGVGKKIVEALKMQSDIEITPVHDDFVTEPQSSVQIEETPHIIEQEPVQDYFSFSPQSITILLNSPALTLLYPTRYATSVLSLLSTRFVYLYS